MFSDYTVLYNCRLYKILFNKYSVAFVSKNIIVLFCCRVELSKEMRPLNGGCKASRDIRHGEQIDTSLLHMFVGQIRPLQEQN